MSDMAFDLCGVYPPISTPFVDGEVSYDHLGANVRKWNETGLSGLVVLGSNGEFPHLTEDEMMRVVEVVAEELAGKKHVVVGTGAPATHTTISRTLRAHDAGAEAVMVIPPYYYRPRMGYDELFSHYTEVADSSPVPVILYNMPAFAGLALAADLIIELSQHPNIVGVKDSSGDVTQMSLCVSSCSSDFGVMAGSGSYLLPGLLMGCAGGVMALANVAPDECVQLHRMAREGRYDDAVALQQRLIPVNQAVTSTYSIPGLKYAMDLRGYFGGEPRKPLLPLDEQGRSDIRRILQEADML